MRDRAGEPRHELAFDGGIHGKLFIERESSDFLYFRRRFAPREGIVSIFEDAETVACFRWIYEEDPPKGEVEGRLDRWLRRDGQLPCPLDPRVRAAIDLILHDPERNASQEEVASSVDLSPSRFHHLFREHTGVPYRRFRRWKRLLFALDGFHRTDNMTRVALESGFADATHFSHSFRDTFGVNPAFVFRGIERFEATR